MKHIIPIIIALLAITYSSTALEVTRTFPDFKLDTPEGETVELGEVLENGPVIVTFWATWCKACIKELRKLSGMEELLESRDITLLAINEDGPRTRGKIRPFIKKEGWTFTTGIDKGGKIKIAAGIADIPELFILGESGEILYHHIGFKPGDEAEYRKKIESLFPAKNNAGREEKELEE